MSYIDEDEYIYVKNNSISNDVCDNLIELFENDASHLVYDGVTHDGNVSEIKKTRDLVLFPNINKYDDELFKELTLNISSYINNISNKYGVVMIPLRNTNDTGFQIQKYIANHGLYNHHHDTYFIKKNNSYTQMRLLTFIWYLNTVDEGGETEFFNGRLKIKPEKGKIVIFPATWTYVHRGNMPISGDKYILTGWFNVDIW
jgi:hypothetical protein